MSTFDSTIVNVVASVMIVLAILAITLWKPRNGLWLLFVLVPLYEIRFKVFGLPTTILELGILGFSLAMLAILIKNRKNLLKKIKAINLKFWLPVVFFVALVFWSGLSILWSGHQLAGFGLWRAFYLEPLVVLLLISFGLKLEVFKLKHLATGLLFSAIIPGLIVIVQSLGYFTLPPWNIEGSDFRLTGPFLQPNMLALYLAPLLPLVVFSEIKRTTKIFVSFFFLLTIIATQSTGGFIAVVVAMLVAAIFKNKNLIVVFKWMLSLVLVGSIIFPFALNYLDKQHDLQVGPSSEIRLELIDVSIKSISARPLLGNGIGNFELAQHEFNPTLLGWPAAHTLLFNYGVELGLIGATLFYLWIASLVKMQPKRDNNIFSIAAMIGLFIMLLHSVVDVSFLKNDLAILAMVFMAIILDRIDSEQPISNQS